MQSIKKIYSSLEKVLHIKRVLTAKLNRTPTIDELSQECELNCDQVTKILVAADGFGCS